MANGNAIRSAALTVILAALLAATGCETVERSVDYDRGEDFARFKTYRWLTGKRTIAGERPALTARLNPLVGQRIHDAIDRALRAKGYHEGEPADFALTYTVGVRERQIVQPWVRYPGPYPFSGGYGPSWGAFPGYAVTNYSEGTITIAIYNAKTMRPVWFGRASKVVDRSDESAERINAIVADILAAFPPRQGGAGAGGGTTY